MHRWRTQHWVHLLLLLLLHYSTPSRHPLYFHRCKSFHPGTLPRLFLRILPLPTLLLLHFSRKLSLPLLLLTFPLPLHCLCFYALGVILARNPPPYSQVSHMMAGTRWCYDPVNCSFVMLVHKRR
jgi:hypothetical protein